MSAAHTPGPWYYGTEEQGRIVVRSQATGLPYVAQTLSTNARLIAAAPDLQNMLQRMVDETSGGHPPCLLTWEHACVALALAKGGAK